ncbi:Asp23/Gls24 family envelope stress response protein [Rhodococcus globerulus]|uniref:Asp23/Gls24 family envelope stress response protein n=1 Tax=Rhodococcus globerulus TaxID=33008 RepID=A0ABU4C4V7_RHOGO|nr:Asp23/Gls24 family envelope stress response protein [Rhodococcus globerulus]MDV6271532.1 Asp23/Gls24 family envelope stress response protein [Rhodococcus globerulus]
MTSTQEPTSTGKDTTSSRGDSVLVSSKGRTMIADTVVSKIAGIATSEVSGVHSLGGGAARAIGQLRERIPGASVNRSAGVSVEVGERQAAVDLDIVAEYGVAIADLAIGIRRNVIAAIERMTSLEVTEVNITVHDVHLDEGPGDSDAPARVQ